LDEKEIATMNYQWIYDEIESRELSWNDSNAALAAALNAVTQAGPSRLLTSAQLMNWAVKRGVFPKVQAALKNSETSAPVLRVAEIAEVMVNNADKSFDANDADHLAMIDSMIATGLATAEDKAALLAYAATTITISEAEPTVARPLTADDVRIARKRRAA
jgi:hypothetical protein